MADVRLKHGIWVVVADGENALFLKNEGDALYPNLSVVREMRDAAAPGREQDGEAAGRQASGAGAGRGYEEADWHRHSKERFADEIAERLYKMAHRGEFEQLVLIAPPVVLGEMRKKLHKEVGDRIVAEFPKTLTNHSVPDIEKFLMAA